MDLVDMTTDLRYDMMRKRHAFLNEIAKQYSSLETFARERDEWFAIRGIELTFHHKCISLYISLGYDEYETYYIIPGKDEKLNASEVIGWQDPYCFNDVINIFTGESVDEEKILTSIHDYSRSVSQNDTDNS